MYFYYDVYYTSSFLLFQNKIYKMSENSITSVKSLDLENSFIQGTGDSMIIGKKDVDTNITIDEDIKFINNNGICAVEISKDNISISENIDITSSGNIKKFIKWDDETLNIGGDGIVLDKNNNIKYNGKITEDNLTQSLLDLITNKKGEIGPIGPPGEPGKDGVDTSFTWTLYAKQNPIDYPNAVNNIKLIPDKDTNFMGVSYNERAQQDESTSECWDIFRYTWLKYKGDNAYSAKIVGSNIFKILKNSNTVKPQTISLGGECSFSNIEETYWMVYDYERQEYVKIDYSTNKLFIDVNYEDYKNILNDNGNISFLFVAIPLDSLNNNPVYDKITIYSLREGDDSINVVLSNAMHTLLTDDNGVILHDQYALANTDVKVFIGINEIKIKNSDFNISSKSNRTKYKFIDNGSDEFTVTIGVTEMVDSADILSITHIDSGITSNFSLYKAGDGKVRMVRISGTNTVWREGDDVYPNKITLNSYGYGGILFKKWQFKKGDGNEYVDLDTSNASIDIIPSELFIGDIFGDNISQIEFKAIYGYEEELSDILYEDTFTVYMLDASYNLLLSNQTEKIGLDTYNNYIFSNVYTDISLYQGNNLIPIQNVTQSGISTFNNDELFDDISISTIYKDTEYDIERLSGNDEGKIRLRLKYCTNNEYITITHIGTGQKKIFSILMDGKYKTSVDIVGENIFYIDENGDCKPDYITLQLDKFHLSDDNVIQWSYLNNTDSWVDIPNANQDTITLYPSIDKWLGYTDTLARIKVRVGDEATNQDTVSIYKLRNASNAINMVLSNETQAISCNSSGVVDKDNNGHITQKVYTSINVYNGTDLMKSNILDYSDSILENVTGVFVQPENDLYSVEFHVTNILSDYGTVKINRNINGVLHTKIFNVFKSKSGQNGQNGAKGDWVTNIFAKSDNKPNRITGVGLNPDPSNWTNNEIWLDAPNGDGIWWMSKANVNGGTNLTYTEFSEPIRVTGIDGEGAYILDLTNENASVVCDYDGNVIGTYPLCTATLFFGSKIVDDASYKILSNNSGVSIDSKTGELTITSLTSDTTELVIEGSYDGNSSRKIMTITKVKGGKNGEPAVIYSLMPSKNYFRVNGNDIVEDKSIYCNVKLEVGKDTHIIANDSDLGDLSDYFNNVSLYVKCDGNDAIGYNIGDIFNISDTTINTEFIIKSGDTILDIENIPTIRDGSEYVYDYKVTTDKSLAPSGDSSGWVSQIPNISTGEYLWMRTVKIVSKKQYILGVSRISGEDGAPGVSGTNILNRIDEINGLRINDLDGSYIKSDSESTIQNITIKPNTYYTFSRLEKGTSVTNTPIRIALYDNSSIFISCFVINKNNMLPYTFNTLENGANLSISYNTDNFVKLEEGREATIFTLSPLDMESKIESAQASANNANSVIDGFNDDNIFDVTEKRAIRTQWELISGVSTVTNTQENKISYSDVGSYKQVVNLAKNIGITNYTELNKSLEALRVFLDNAELYSNNIKYGFADERKNLKNVFGNYYGEETKLLENINKANTNESINGISIGGSNYILNSSFYNNLVNWESISSYGHLITNSIGDGLKECIIRSTYDVMPVGGEFGIKQTIQNASNIFTKGNKLFLSCFVKLYSETLDTFNIKIKCIRANGTHVYINWNIKPLLKLNDWVKLDFPIEISEDFTSAELIFALETIGYVSVCKIQLEEGTIPTSWDKNTLDIETEINKRVLSTEFNSYKTENNETFQQVYNRVDVVESNFEGVVPFDDKYVSNMVYDPYPTVGQNFDDLIRVPKSNVWLYDKLIVVDGRSVKISLTTSGTITVSTVYYFNKNKEFIKSSVHTSNNFETNLNSEYYYIVYSLVSNMGFKPFNDYNIQILNKLSVREVQSQITQTSEKLTLRVDEVSTDLTEKVSSLEIDSESIRATVSRVENGSKNSLPIESNKLFNAYFSNTANGIKYNNLIKISDVRYWLYDNLIEVFEKNTIEILYKPYSDKTALTLIYFDKDFKIIGKQTFDYTSDNILISYACRYVIPIIFEDRDIQEAIPFDEYGLTINMYTSKSEIKSMIDQSADEISLKVVSGSFDEIISLDSDKLVKCQSLVGSNTMVIGKNIDEIVEALSRGSGGFVYSDLIESYDELYIKTTSNTRVNLLFFDIDKICRKRISRSGTNTEFNVVGDANLVYPYISFQTYGSTVSDFNDIGMTITRKSEIANSSNLKATGIDISKGKIDMYADKFNIKDGNGTPMGVFEMVDNRPMLKTGFINAEGITASSLQLKFDDYTNSGNFTITDVTKANLAVGNNLITLPIDAKFIGKVLNLYNTNKSYGEVQINGQDAIHKQKFTILQCSNGIFGGINDTVSRAISSLINAEFRSDISYYRDSNNNIIENYLMPLDRFYIGNSSNSSVDALWRRFDSKWYDSSVNSMGLVYNDTVVAVPTFRDCLQDKIGFYNGVMELVAIPHNGGCAWQILNNKSYIDITESNYKGEYLMSGGHMSEGCTRNPIYLVNSNNGLTREFSIPRYTDSLLPSMNTFLIILNPSTRVLKINLPDVTDKGRYNMGEIQVFLPYIFEVGESIMIEINEDFPLETNILLNSTPLFSHFGMYDDTYVDDAKKLFDNAQFTPKNNLSRNQLIEEYLSSILKDNDGHYFTYFTNLNTYDPNKTSGFCIPIKYDSMFEPTYKITEYTRNKFLVTRSSYKTWTITEL